MCITKLVTHYYGPIVIYHFFEVANRLYIRVRDCISETQSVEENNFLYSKAKDTVSVRGSKFLEGKKKMLKPKQIIESKWQKNCFEYNNTTILLIIKK